MSLHILRHLPFLSRNTASTVDPKTCRALPPGLDTREVKAWTSRLGDAKRLLTSMNSETDLSHVRSGQASVKSSNAPTGVVNRATLLRVLLRGQPGGQAAPELHANRVAPGVVLMAAPHEKEAMLWAEACVQHRVGHVVDLCTKEESRRLRACMDNPATLIRGDLAVAFDARNTNADLRDIPDAEMQQVEVALGHPDADASGGPSNKLTQDLAWTRVPVSKDRAIAPQTLLDVCRHVESQPLRAGETVVFQCADGGHRGAVFAAAHELHKRLRAGGLDRHNLERSVVETCTTLRLNRNVDLFDEPEQIASLLALGDLMLQEERLRARVAAKPGPVLRSALKGASNASAGSPAARRAVHFGGSRDVDPKVDVRHFPVDSPMTPTSEASRARTVPGTDFEA